MKAFKSGAKWRVLIASYENIRKHCSLLKNCIDLLICDEGHRLKSAGGNNTMDALLELNCLRRVILTGTPVQNNLKECVTAATCCITVYHVTSACINFQTNLRKHCH